MNTQNNKRKSKFILPITIIALLVISMIVVLANNKKKINEKATAIPQSVGAIPTKIAKVEQQEIDNGLEMTGFFAARQTLPLIAEAQGSVIQLNIKEGQSINAGQVVACIDPTSVKSNLASAQATYNNAVKNKERYQRLAEAGALSQKQYEDVALNVENALTNMRNIQQQMKYTIIRSPMSGVVSEVKVEQGSFATPGMELGSVVDISSLKMVFQVAEQDVVKLKKGQPVVVTTDVYPGHEFNGNISLISVQADAARKYDVEVQVANSKDFPLKAGMFGTAKLNTINSGKGTALFIPRQAIVGSIENAQVFVLNSDSTVSLKSIQVQNQSGDKVIVLVGLSADEQVIVSGQINLQSGNKVRVVSE
ncbi:MAG: efflux RND transporter periplasmic adaptor subunit [Bacteroidetes bacterium]|nr:efflux RND transporter periplasmic adaptor subunit [Bacteroidota bacterium]